MRALTGFGALAAACVLAAVALPARAVAAAPLAWSNPALVDNVSGEGSTSEIRGVSCIGSSLCVAVGDAGKVVTSLDPADATPVWHASRVDSENSLKGVSCLPSPSLCVAVDDQGNVVTSTDPTDGAAAAWSVDKIDGGLNPATSANNTLDSVSCVASPLLCVAVDNNGNVFTSTDPTDGASAAWTQATVETGQAVDELNSVSCVASPLLCVAVDNSGNVLVSGDPRGGASAWAITNVDATNNIKGVSCASASLCVAVDAKGNALTSTNPTAAVPTWTPLDIDASNDLYGVSCQSSTLCVAVDSKGNALTTTNPTAAATATWASLSIDKPKLLGIPFPDSVSCPAASLCVVGDTGGSELTSIDPASGATATWAKQLVDDTNSIDGMSCPSTSLCVGVDNSGNSVTSSDPGDGATASWALDPLESKTRLSGVSCPSTSLCVAVDNTGNVLTTTDPADAGTAVWTPADVDGTRIIDGVSCSSTSLCVAVDDGGNVLTSTNPTGGASAWTAASVDGTATINGVSCASSSLCVAVDNAGNVLTSSNPTGGASAWTAANVDATATINGVSCPSSSLCVATDNHGDVLTSTNPTGGTSAWTAANVDTASTSNSLNAVACFSSSLCVAVDGHGNAVISTNPTAGNWTLTPVDDNSDMTAVACPAETVCAAADSNGNAMAGLGHVLTVDVAGSGSGTVSTGDGSILCPGDCSTVYAPGTTVTMTAVPANGSRFDGWSGGGCSGTGACTVAMGSDQSVTASFTLFHTLTVALAGAGSGTVTSADAAISCPGTCSSPYASGATATLTAVPASGSTFAGWSGGGCSGVGSCTVTMGSDQDVTASFTPLYTLTLALAGSGSGTVTSADRSISCPGNCSSVYAPGTTVTLAAVPAAGSRFDGWSGGGCSGTGSCTVAMGSDQSVAATFTALRTLTVALAGAGSGTVTSADGSISCPGTCSSVSASGATATLTAVPANGSTFSGWSGGGCSGTGSCTVTMGSNQDVTATFGVAPPAVTTPPIATPPHPMATPPPRKPSCTLVPDGSRVTARVHTERKHGKVVKVAPSRTLKLTARCDQAAQLTLTGKITWIAERAKGHPQPHAKTSQLRAMILNVAAGAPRTLVVRLPTAALGPGSRDSVAFTLQAVNADGSSTATARLAHLILL